MEIGTDLFFKIIDNINDIIIVADFSGKIKFASKNIKGLTGYKIKELLELESISKIIGDCFYDITNPDNASKITESRCSLIDVNGEAHAITLSVVKTDDSLIYICRELTRAEHLNEEEVIFLDKLLKSVPEAVIVTDDSGNVLRWLGYAQYMFNYSAEEIRGQSIETIYKGISFDTITKRDQFFGEIDCKNKDGMEVFIEGDVKKIIDDSGNYLFYLHVYRDITEKKRLEQVMNEYYDNLQTELEKMVEERTIELQEANQKLEDYNKNLEHKVAERTKELNKLNKTLEAKNQEMLKELKMAQRIQLGIIPDENAFPKREELNFGSKYLSMEAVGGDIYDVIRIGRNGFGFLMADVSGHGVPAALITSMVKVSFNSHSDWGVLPSEVCYKVNNEMMAFIGDLDYYLSAYYGIINLETGEFQYTNAGHHPVILSNPDTEELVKLDSDGCLIGALYLDEHNYETKSIKLKKNDRILFFTDGINEARNADGDFYGYDRLEEFVVKNRKLSPKDFVESLISDVEKFCGTRPPDDDRAVLCIEVLKDITSISEEEKSLNKSVEQFVHLDIEDKSEEKKSEKDVLTQHKEAISYLKRDIFDKALEILTELRKIEPNNTKILNNLAVVYFKLNEFNKAYDLLQEAVTIDDNNEVLKQNLALMLKKIEQN